MGTRGGIMERDIYALIWMEQTLPTIVGFLELSKAFYSIERKQNANQHQNFHISTKLSDRLFAYDIPIKQYNEKS